jgi:3-methyl-2-oxobutanoate hydroxymethyltransferase
MAMHGFDSTVHADIPLMKPHIEAVARGDKFIVGDMPFLSCSRGLAAAIDGAQTLIEAGSMAIKIERHTHQVDIIDHIVDAGVPVIGHIGLPPPGSFTASVVTRFRGATRAKHTRTRHRRI